MGKTISARVPFNYDGHMLERGEVFQLRDKPNDDRLLILRYIQPFDPTKERTHTCDNCGKKFVDEAYYIMHKRKKDCMDPTKPISDAEVAELTGKDPEKFKFDRGL